MWRFSKTNISTKISNYIFYDHHNWDTVFYLTKMLFTLLLLLYDKLMLSKSCNCKIIIVKSVLQLSSSGFWSQHFTWTLLCPSLDWWTFKITMFTNVGVLSPFLTKISQTQRSFQREALSSRRLTRVIHIDTYHHK